MRTLHWIGEDMRAGLLASLVDDQGNHFADVWPSCSGGQIGWTVYACDVEQTCVGGYAASVGTAKHDAMQHVIQRIDATVRR